MEDARSNWRAVTLPFILTFIVVGSALAIAFSS